MLNNIRLKICILIVILLSILFKFEARGDSDLPDNDSCIAGVTIIKKIINNIVSLTGFADISSRFNMTSAEGSECSTPTNKVKFYYDNGYWTDETKLYHLGNEEEVVILEQTLGGIPNVRQFRGMYVADKICVQVKLISGWQNLGCKYRPDPSVTTDIKSSCYAGQSCTANGKSYSQNNLPMTAAVIQCVKESMHRIFADQAGCDSFSDVKVNLFPTFQNSMKEIVKAALILYVLLFGIKIVLGADLPNKGEVFIFFTKFILVMYFSVGIHTGTDAQGNNQYEDGVTKYLQPTFNNATAALSSIVYNAGGSDGLCIYDKNDYESGFNYLALWDSIDCRVFYYLGLGPSGASSKAFDLIIPAFFVNGLMFVVILIVFAVFFIATIVYFTHMYIIAIIGLAILTYLAPLFVPFALFNATKGYFDSWLRLVFSYTLQPMIVAAFIALMLTVFDQAMYGNCKFQKETVSLFGISYSTFVVKVPSEDKEKCTNSFGYILNESDNLIEKDTGTFFESYSMSIDIMMKMYSALLTIVVFTILFYNFVDMLSGFAADLTSGNALGQLATSPKQVVDKAADAAKKAAKMAAGVPPVEEGGRGSGSGMKASASKKRDSGISASASKGGGSSSKVHGEN